MDIKVPTSTQVFFDNASKFNRDFIPLLNEFATTPIYKFINKPQSNTLVERIHQVIYNMIVNKDIDSK